jgi:sialate O-acetylesterase
VKQSPAFRSLAVLTLLPFAALKAAEATAAPPNIIVILTDDHGWADLGANGVDRHIRTPNLDQLAADGVRFTRTKSNELRGPTPHPRMNLGISPIIALLLAPLATLHAADLKIAGVFTDHTVLQREQPLPVWGLAAPNDEITVKFASQSKSAKADANGKWLVKLDPLTASAQGRDLIVTAGDEETRITDVLVGDVWLCSGQSNMHFQMKSVDKAPQEIAAANHPTVRFFTVKQQFGQQASDDTAGVWKPVSPATAADCSAVACFFGTSLQQKTGVPVGLLISSVGGTRIESWMRPETLAATGESAPLIAKWKSVSPEEFETIGKAYSAFQHERDHLHPQAVKAAKAQGKPAPPAPVMPKLRCHDAPSSLHHGMIAPLQPFAIRGAVWYQGESNSGQAAAYEKLLPAMIADWRSAWGKELPFLFVQLASYRNTHPSFREAQHRIWQKTPRTAMVVTTDVGDAANIHPTRKRPVGERLALAARAISYGQNVVYSGPVFKGMSIENDRAVLSFTHTGTGLTAEGGALKGFTLAGPDGKFLPARAVIEGANVVVTSDKIARPTAVRYGWAMMADGNLYNREGLPAAPFRSDAPVPGKAAIFEVGGNKAYLFEPAAAAAGKPWIWYAPTIKGDVIIARHKKYFDAFMQEGIALAGFDLGEVRGAPASTAKFTDFYDAMIARGYSSKPILLGQSRGGLMTLAWAVRNPEKVRAWAGIYPVCNLTSWPMRFSKNETLADFSLTEEALLSRLAEFNPVDNLAGLAARRVPMFSVHGDKDGAVPYDENTRLVKERYEAAGGECTVKIISGGGHEVTPAFFECQELIDFIVKHSQP